MHRRIQNQQELHTRQGKLLLYFFVALLISAFFWQSTDYEYPQDPFIPKPVYDTSNAFEKVEPIASSETTSGDGTVRL